MRKADAGWRREKGRLVARVALALVATAGRLEAQEGLPESALHVRFAGPPECPEHDLATFTRGLLEQHTHAEVHVDAEVSRRSTDVYELNLRLRGSVEGERRLVAPSCGEALRAGAVVIALAVNPEALASDEAREPVASEAATPDAPTAPSADERAPQLTPQPAARQANVNPAAVEAARSEVDQGSGTLRLGASARLVYGLAPDPRAGAQLSFGYAARALKGRLHAFYDPTTSNSHPRAGAVRLTSYGAGAELCARLLTVGSVGAALCGGWQVTGVSAEAPELTRSRPRRATVSAAVLGVSADWELHPQLAVVFDAGAALPTTRPRFVFDVSSGETILVSQVRPGAVLALGMEWRL